MKNKLSNALLLVIMAGFFSSCEKDADNILETSSLTIINSISGGGVLVANFDANKKLQYYKTAQQIPAYNNPAPFFQFSGYKRGFPIAIYQLTDTLKSIYSGTINVVPNGIHSLFLTGSTAAVDTIFTKDILPQLAAADSLMGIRFVNASIGSTPISVNLANQSAAPIETSLPYKGVSAFKTYSVKKAVPAVTDYVFEVREASSSRLIATYTLNSLTTRLNRNFTVALRGIPNGTGANVQALFLVNNY